jgi:hypothetical protein
MTNLSDLERVLERIHEKLGGNAPERAAASMTPIANRTASDSAPTAGKKEKELTADDLANAFGKVFNNIPVLKDIAKQISFVREVFKTSGAAAATRMSLDGGLKYAQRLIAGETVVRKVSAVSKYTSKLKSLDYKTILEAFPGLNKGVLKNRLEDAHHETGESIDGSRWNIFKVLRDKKSLERLFWPRFYEKVNEAKYDPESNRWRNIHTGKFLPTATPENISKLARAGGLPPELSKLLDGAMKGVMLRYGLVIGGFVTGAIAVTTALLKLGKAAVDANRGIAGFSGMMAMSFAMSDVRDTFRNIASANARARSTAGFLNEFSNLKDAWRPIADDINNMMAEAGGAVSKFATNLIKGFDNLRKYGHVAEPTTKEIKDLNELIMYRDTGVYDKARELYETPPKSLFDFWRPTLTQLRKADKIMKSDRAAAAAYQDLDLTFDAHGIPLPSSKNQGITASFNGINDLTEAVRAATETIKDWYNKYSGPEGTVAMDAGGFMAGVVASSSWGQKSPDWAHIRAVSDTYKRLGE